MTEASSMSQYSGPQLNIKNLRHIDLTNAEEFFKLKGATLDEHLLRLILKSFRTSTETRVQEERLQTESALSEAKSKQNIDKAARQQIRSL